MIDDLKFGHELHPFFETEQDENTNRNKINKR